MSDNSKFTSERYYLSEEAYTASAVMQKSKPGKRHARRAGRTATLFILFALLCIAIAVACALLMINYNFEIESGDGISLHITKRNAPAPSESHIDISGLFKPSENEQDNSVSAAEIVPWSGSKLDVNEKLPEKPDKLSYQQIYEKCAPSMVSISISQDMINYEPAGSGIIMSSDGYIIADAYAISHYSDIKVRLYSGEIFTAALAASDPVSGLAVIKIDATKLVPADFAYSSDKCVGDSVVSISNPIDGSFTLSPGIVSSAEQELSFYGYTISVFQTNAYCGSYCSAVIDGFGHVVGIGSLTFSLDKRLNNLYFVLPITTVKSVVDDLLEYGYVTGRPTLGLSLRDIPAAASVFYGMPKGVFVSEVYEKSDAFKKGIQAGDIITSFNSQPVSSVLSLNELKNKCSVGDMVTLEIIRNEEVLNFEIVLEDYSVTSD